MKSQLLPPTQRRVELNTAAEINERNRLLMERRLREFEGADREVINARIFELENEWDIERTLQANAAIVSLLSLGLSMMHSRKWLLLTGTVAGFLLQHALQGWCPPVPIFRQRGVRTSREIYEEIAALRGMQGGSSISTEADKAAAV